MDNIIFIIFVFLFIIVILGINTNINQENFEVQPNHNATTRYFVTDTTSGLSTTPTTGTPTSITASGLSTSPSSITNITTAASGLTTTTTPRLVATTTLALSTPGLIATTAPALNTPGLIATTAPALNTPGLVATATPGLIATTMPPSISLSNTSMWFDPKYIDYWINTFSPTELKYKPYNVTLYNITKNFDPNGILKPTATNPGVIFNNYMKIAFDNTKSDYNNFTQNPIISVQTKIKNIPIGNYLMTYYVSSTTNNTDTQSISVTSGVNSEIGTPFILRNFVNGGVWVKQQYAFSITDTSDNIIQFQFELFDTKSPGLSILAVGGIDIQSCGNQLCDVECTTYYTDWGICDVTKGISTRNAELIARNNDTTCPVPLITGNCLNAINFTNGLTDWNIKTTPIDALTNNFIKIPVFTPSTITDAYQFNMNSIPFNTPFTVVNFVNNKINTFNQNINPTVTITTSLKLQAGNYQISYYIQSSETQQLINVSSIIGNGSSAVTTQTIPSNVVNPLEWYLIKTNFLVTMDSVVPIQFIFTLKDIKSLISSAIALGGINISYCGNQPCEIISQSKSTTKPYSFTTTPYSSYITTSPISDVINTVSTIPESCYTDWSDCKINFNNNITNDMLTSNIKKDIESVIKMYPNNDSSKQLTLDQFVNNYNDVLSKYYTKTRKLSPYASESCINSATLHDLLMTNC